MLLHELRRDKPIVHIAYELPKDAARVASLCKNNIVVVSGKSDIFRKIDAKYHCNIFLEHETLFCPLDHVLVDRHRLATDEEIAGLPKDMRLPIIYSNDIICRWSNFPLNSIVAIEREDGLYFRKLTAIE